MNDEELLKTYVGEGSQDAFAELVQRHLGLVYATALRLLHEPAAAQDVTQQAFCALAQKAATLRDPRHVAAWLHRTSRQLSALHCRTEQRRSRREQAVAMNLTAAENDQRWDELEPLLDQALEGLGDAERTALLLRFFEGRPMAEVGAALGVTEAAAKMRIGRALEKLRGSFARQGITCSAAGLVLLFDRHAHASAPDGLITNVLAVTRSSIPFSSVSPVGWLGWVRRVFWPLAGATALLVGAWLITSKLGSSSAAGPSPSELVVSQADPAAVPPAGDEAPLALDSAARIEFTVVDDETGEALAGVQIRAAEFVGSLPTVDVATDTSGRCRVTKPTTTGNFYFQVTVRHPGYVSRWIRWSRYQRDAPSDIPADYVIRLQRGIRIGGVVNDATGSPIPGATVELDGDSFWMGAPPRDCVLLHDNGRETVTTDDQGRWSFTGLPPELSRFLFRFRSLEFIEAKFITDTSDRTRFDIEAAHLSSAELLAETAVVTLETGRRLAGRITDTQGNPIGGAQIVQNRLWGDAFRRAVSDDDGTFEFRNLSDGPQTLVVQAPGFAATSVAVQVPTPSDLRVEMRPGQIVRGRIVDQDQQGVAQAQVELTAGPGYRQESRPEFQMEFKTDSEGRFTWDQAPGNSLPVTISKTGYSAREASLTTDGAETLVVLEKADQPPPMRVVGRVVDDETGALIERFRVVVGDHGYGNEVIKSGEDGIFSLTLYDAETSIEVRAAGYQPSRQEVPPGGATEHSMEFRLVAAAGWTGFVMLPDGRPASDAEVALITDNKRPTLERRRFTNREFANVTLTDADGVFHFESELPDIEGGRRLVAVHDTGYAEHDADTWSPGAILRLQPWGRVQGMVQGRSAYPAQLKVYLEARSWNPWLFSHSPFSTVSGERGEFVFDDIPPGYYSIGLVPERASSIDKRVTLQVTPGTTSRVEVSDEGLTLAGQLVASDLPADFDFTHSRGVLGRRQSRPVDLPRVRPQDFSNREAYEQASREQTPKRIAYWQSAEGISAWMEERKYTLVLHADGTFVVRAVPPGDYDLQVMATSVPPGQPNVGAHIKSPIWMPLTSLEPVRIEPTGGSAPGEPVDVGPVALGKRF